MDIIKQYEKSNPLSPHYKRSNSMTEVKKYIKITPDMFKDLEFKIELPTFQCSCGEEILLTPENMEQSLQDSTKES